MTYPHALATARQSLGQGKRERRVDAASFELATAPHELSPDAMDQTITCVCLDLLDFGENGSIVTVGQVLQHLMSDYSVSPDREQLKFSMMRSQHLRHLIGEDFELIM